MRIENLFFSMLYITSVRHFCTGHDENVYYKFIIYTQETRGTISDSSMRILTCKLNFMKRRIRVYNGYTFTSDRITDRMQSFIYYY